MTDGVQPSLLPWDPIDNTLSTSAACVRHENVNLPHLCKSICRRVRRVTPKTHLQPLASFGLPARLMQIPTLQLNLAWNCVFVEPALKIARENVLTAVKRIIFPFSIFLSHSVHAYSGLTHISSSAHIYYLHFLKLITSLKVTITKQNFVLSTRYGSLIDFLMYLL